jgi:hypothetical protein
MRIHEIILESEEPSKDKAIDVIDDVQQTSDDAIEFFKSIDKQGIEVDIDSLKQIDEDWKSKLKIAAVGGMLGLTSLLANAGQDPQKFGELMAKCSAINYWAAEVADSAGASKSLVGEFRGAFLKTSKMGKELIGQQSFENKFDQERKNVLQKYNDGSGKVNTINMIKDLELQSGICDALIDSVKDGSIQMNKSNSSKDNAQSSPQYSPEQVAKYWSDVKDYKGGKSKNGLPQGKGSITWTDGMTYVGNFDNGSLNGEGVMTFSSGEKIEGIFSAANRGNIERGTHTYKDGSKFVGEFNSKGKPDNGRGYDVSGKEIYTYVNGKKIEIQSQSQTTAPQNNSSNDLADREAKKAKAIANARARAASDARKAASQNNR